MDFEDLLSRIGQQCGPCDLAANFPVFVSSESSVLSTTSRSFEEVGVFDWCSFLVAVLE